MLTLSQVYKSPSAFLCALLAAGVSLADVRPGSSCDPLCKSVPGSAGWPSTETWASLNESTGGRLLRPSPPGAVCHSGQPTFDNATCRGVQAGWTSYEFHDADPVSVDWNQYSNDSCLPDPHYPCSGEGYPVFVINATTAEHVKLGVDFAREHHIRLIVKSSGHDFIGRSIAPNSLSIWTHHMTGLQTHEGFQPKSCKVTIDGGAVTAGAGSAMAELYGALGSINRTVIGGGGKTVSLGGYLTGAGHSLLSSRYGLATDQVLEMEVVTPKGEILTINECSHQDLFWAMRGGGGSTFAIMTSVTVKTFPSPRLACGDIIVATDANSFAAKSVPDLAAYVVSQFPDLGDAGMSGYSYILRDFPNPYDPSSGSVAGFYASMCIQDTQDTTEFLTLWNPIFKHINETWPGFSIVPNLANFTSFSGWYAVNYDKSTTGTDSYVGSRLLDKKALTSNVTALAAALDRLSSGGTATAFLVSGKGVMDAKPRGGGDAVNPAWRKAYVHSTFGVEFEPLNASAKAEALQKINYMLEPMRELAPDMGAYMNEANPEEPDWQHQFWGDHYGRLVEIKRDVDPQDVLWCTPCVGNERWKEHDGMLCRV